MNIEIPKFSEKSTENISDNETENNSKFIASIPPGLPNVYNSNTPTASFKILSENLDRKIGGHKGVNKMYQRIREKYFSPGIKEQVTDFVRKCKVCQEQKIVRAEIHESVFIYFR